MGRKPVGPAAVLDPLPEQAERKPASPAEGLDRWLVLGGRITVPQVFPAADLWPEQEAPSVAVDRQEPLSWGFPVPLAPPSG